MMLKLFETNNNRSIRASRSVLRIRLCSSVRLSISSQHKISEMSLQLFLIFCMSFEGFKVRKVTEFLKKALAGEENPKGPKNAKKMRLPGF